MTPRRPGALRRGAASDPVDRPRPSYPIDSVDNVLRLLLFIEERSAVRVSEASAALGVAQSTVHRLLAMLEHHGFVQQDAETKIYLLGPALLRLGLNAVRNLEIRSLVHPYLEKVHEELGETVHLALPDGEQVLFIDCIESTKALRVSSRLGRHMWAHCTSIGKAMLAFLPEERLLALYPEEELAGITPASITSRSALLAELAAVRRRGYAENRGESEEGVGSVAVPLCGVAGTPVAGLSVSFPLVRASAALRAEAARALREASETVSAVLF